LFTTRAERDGDEWVINGEKFFSSNAQVASFLIVMAVTNPDVSPYRGMSMFLVPTDTPGINILDVFGTAEEPLGVGAHAHIRYENVRVPAEGLLGGEGQAFAIAQTRLGGGRVHHAMRVVGQARRAFDMMCERALSRYTKGSILAEKQAVQHYIASSYAEIEQFRLFVLYTAWKIDQVRGGYSNASTRKEIAVCKVLAAKVLHDVVSRAVQVHGALGISNHMPLGQLWIEVPWMGIMDGPTEVHEGTVSREVLKSYSPAVGTWPSEFLPPKIDAARARFADALEHHVANL
jgi:acyl-CoA dehydrogenase